MSEEEVLALYKKHERMTTPDVAAVLTIAQLLGGILKALENINYDM